MNILMSDYFLIYHKMNWDPASVVSTWIKEVSLVSKHSHFLRSFFVVTCHLCQFLIFPSFPDVTLFIAKGPNVIPSSLIIVMLGLTAKEIWRKKKHVSSNGKRRQRSERKVFIYFEPFLSKQCYFEWQFFIGGRYIYVVIFQH